MGSIRGEVDRYHFFRHPEDRAHVEGLLHWFDVTHGERTRGQGTSSSIYYLKPVSPDVARFIGIDENREILYLFSPSANLEARDITAADAAIEKASPRLDPHLSLIGSADPKTGDRVKRYLSEDQERTPIVGFSLGDIASIDKPDDLYRLFQQRHFVRDYFALEAPLTEEAMFFGRADMVSELAERIGAGQNSGLFGLRRIGKTSILYAVGRRCHSTKVGYAYYRDLSPAYHLRWWQVLELIIREVAAQLELGKSARRRVRAIAGYEQYQAAIDFGADIEFLAARVPHGRLVLLLDEIEYVTFDLSPAEHWREDFLAMWSTMRSVHQNSRGRFTFIVAGVNPYATERHRIENHDNPLFSTVRNFFVSPLGEADAAAMVRSLGRMMGISVDREFLDRLFAAYGGHPFLTRQACSHLARHLDTRPAVLTGTLFEKDQAHTDAALVGVVKQILTVLETWYPEEFELLQGLALGDDATFREFATASAEFCEHVVGYGLVRSPQDRPALTIGLVGKVLRQMASESVVDSGRRPEPRADVVGEKPQTADSAASPVEEPDDNEEWWLEVIGEVSRRRNRIERALRDRGAMGLEIKFGQGKMNRLLESIGGARQTKLSNNSYKDVWQELYLLELTSVFVENWDVFQNWAYMDKNEFESALQTINKGRVDAHARSISEDDLAYLRVCLRKIEDRVGLS